VRGVVIFNKTKLLTPALSSFSEEREKIQILIRQPSVKCIFPQSSGLAGSGFMSDVVAGYAAG
jgi:hypothetical protein